MAKPGGRLICITNSLRSRTGLDSNPSPVGCSLSSERMMSDEFVVVGERGEANQRPSSKVLIKHLTEQMCATMTNQ